MPLNRMILPVAGDGVGKSRTLAAQYLDGAVESSPPLKLLWLPGKSALTGGHRAGLFGSVGPATPFLAFAPGGLEFAGPPARESAGLAARCSYPLWAGLAGIARSEGRVNCRKWNWSSSSHSQWRW
jgi:hypothetical protein